MFIYSLIGLLRFRLSTPGGELLRHRDLLKQTGMKKKIIDLNKENMQIIDDVYYLQGQIQSAEFSLTRYDEIENAKAIKNTTHNIKVYKRLIRIKKIRFTRKIELMHKKEK